MASKKEEELRGHPESIRPDGPAGLASAGAGPVAAGPGGVCLVRDIRWDSWVPVERATLLFVVRRGEVLLIRKKRGLGAGKINAPGGRIEPGETPLQAAERETVEEVGVRPVGIAGAGVLYFQFVDGFSILGHVFRADDCEGTAIETDEAIPRWVGLGAIPYDEMWEDDRYWVPLMLERRMFKGYFVFDGDRMVDYQIDA